jgi:hypothetical protein
MQPLAALLRPLVRLLIQCGVTFPVLADMLRGLYVEVARRDLLADPKARTDSRVSLLTGVHRKEIRRQRAPEPAPAEPVIVTRTSGIIARWLGTPGYAAAGAGGAPSALPRSGPAPSFEALVASVTRDVRPRAVLDEWLSQGIVRLDGEGRVVLDAGAFLPRDGGGGAPEDWSALLFYFARNLHDHIAAASANVLANGAAPFLERSVHYDRLRPAAAGRLASLGRDAAQAMLLDVNRVAAEIADADDAAAGPVKGGRRVNLGVYLYFEDEPSRDAEAGDVKADDVKAGDTTDG